MAHEIDMTTGKAAVFVTGEKPWHGLGKVIESAANSAEAIGLAGLDWKVEQWPLTAFGPTGHRVDAVGEVANVRTDTNAILGLVSDSYRVFQNVECFDFMDALVGEKLAMYETAGSLFGGKRIWMLASIPKEYRAGSEDVVKPYVLLVNSHTGNRALRMIPTTVRVVCNNTLNLALGEAGSGEGLSITHHPNLDQRVAEARAKLGIIVARFDDFDAELHAMIAEELNVARARQYFETVLPESDTVRGETKRDEIIGQMMANFDNERNTLPGIKHTAWAAYNAVSEYADHQKDFRGRDDAAKANNRLNSAWFGSGNNMKQLAYANALALVK